MTNQTIQELASFKAAKLLFQSKLNILKGLLKSKKITNQQFAEKLKMLKYKYGSAVVATLNDPTMATTLDRYLNFVK